MNLTFDELQDLINLNKKDFENCLLKGMCGYCGDYGKKLYVFVKKDKLKRNYMPIRCSRCSTKKNKNITYFKLSQKDIFAIKCLI